MTGKELLGHLDGTILCIDIGAGDTVFSGCWIDNDYQLFFKLLDNPATPGETVDIKVCKAAQPYLSIDFNNIESFRVFSEFVAEFYQLAQEAKSEAAEGNNV